MLCDLFVEPTAQGHGCGRAMLAELWSDATNKMTFSSLHSRAAPLYTSFGLDAWWPLLYLHGDAGRLPVIGGLTVVSVSAVLAASYERDWTGVARAADYQAWAARPGGESVVVSRADEVIAAGAIVSIGQDRGIVHLAMSPTVDDGTAVGVVLQIACPASGSGSADCARVPAGAAPCCPHPAGCRLAVRRVRPVHGYGTGPARPAPRRALARPGLTVPGAKSPQRNAAEAGPELMAHGYTHRTTRTGDVVTKTYRGPERERLLRARRQPR